jgi:thiosulfate/3-mercaptopyruvate sulfurtransferase
MIFRMARRAVLFQNTSMHTTLISVGALHAAMQSTSPPLVLDSSFDLSDAQAGQRQFQDTHLPGAVHADLDRDLSDKSHPAGARAGRHPLPARERFAAWLSSAGLTQGRQVVVYDRQGGNYCGRLWWMLKWAGHEAAAVLDGGLQAWQAAGLPTESGPARPTAAGGPDAFQAQASLVQVFDTAAIQSRLGDPGLTILDARAAPRFRGEVEPLDPVAGHIPGALNRPFTDNIGPDGRFRPADELRKSFEALLAGRDPASVVHHCGSGVSALPNLLAMAVAGMGVTGLYPGSWSAWCNTPGNPIAQNPNGVPPKR